MLSEPLRNARNPSNDTAQALEGAVQTLNSQLNDHRTAVETFHSNINELGLDVYADAYEETIVTDELAHINDTIELINNVLDTYSRKELANGPDELGTVADRLETITNWSTNSEPYAVQIHRHVTDQLWSCGPLSKRLPQPTRRPRPTRRNTHRGSLSSLRPVNSIRLPRIRMRACSDSDTYFHPLVPSFVGTSALSRVPVATPLSIVGQYCRESRRNSLIAEF